MPSTAGSTSDSHKRWSSGQRSARRHAVTALPVQSLYENDRIYAVRTDAGNENRLEAIAVERVGEVRAEDGQHRILVRSPAIGRGARIITTQLPRAIAGLLVEPA